MFADDIVQAQAASARTRAYPAMLAGGNVGVELGFFFGSLEESCPEVLAQIVAFGQFLFRLSNLPSFFAWSDDKREQRSRFGVVYPDPFDL